MTAPRLARAAGRAPPVRLVHLGLGSFFRAHQAVYTDRAADADQWGYAAFGGRRSELADTLADQGGLYTLITRAGDGDRFDVVASLALTHGADDHADWRRALARPELAVVTITVTEAGYLRAPDGGLDRTRPEVRADLEVLRRDPAGPARTAPGRLVSGLAARRRSDAGPLAVVPCDNLAGNGDLVRRVVVDLAELVDPALAEWITGSVSFVTTMVDRITPRTTADDVRTVRERTGRDDRCPVVTEAFTEWVLSGSFPAGRPRWEDGGARFTDDVSPHEHRKLWLLNGAHSLLAYAGPLRGHATVAEAIADPTCRAWVEQWWAEASGHLDQPGDELAAYRSALVERFANARIAHRLAQIAADGSQKLPVRIVPTVRAERAAGREAAGGARVLAAWVCHLRGAGSPVDDPAAATLVPLVDGPLPDAVRWVLATLDPHLVDDATLVATVLELSRELQRSAFR